MSNITKNIYDVLSLDDEINNDNNDNNDNIDDIDKRKKKLELISNDFNKLLGYDKDKIFKLILELEVYKDIDNLNKFIKFILDFNNDFGKYMSNYSVINKIKSLLEKDKYYTQLKYERFLTNNESYIKNKLFKNILFSSINEFEYLINKYNNIYFDSDILPLEFLTVPKHRFNLSNLLISYLVNTEKNDEIFMKNNDIINFNYIKLIIINI